MEIRLEIVAIIIGTGIVTLLPRVVPLIFLSKIELPKWFLDWLSFVPVTVMSALLAQEVLFKDNKLHLHLDNLEFFAMIPTFIVALYTKSLLGAVVVGMICISLLRLFF